VAYRLSGQRVLRRIWVKRLSARRVERAQEREDREPRPAGVCFVLSPPAPAQSADMLSYKLLFAVYLLTGLSYALAVLLPLRQLLQLL